MKKLRVSPALLALCAAVLLFVGAFFLGRASALGEARITVQRAAPASDALQIDGSGEGKLCLNTATREELLALPGVGEKTADRILSYRDTYGRFSAVEQLLDVEAVLPHPAAAGLQPRPAAEQRHRQQACEAATQSILRIMAAAAAKITITVLRAATALR